MGPNPRYLEELRVGGGYGDSSDGGADFEKNGNIRTNGGLVVDGAVSVGHLAVADKFETCASTTSRAGLRITPGIIPTLLQDGDVWTTSAGIYVRINGVTVGPLGSGGGGSADWANPGTIGSSTPNTGQFTTLSSTGNFVCAGDVSVNGGDITSTATVLNVTGSGDVRINAGGTDRSVKMLPTGTGGVWCGNLGAAPLYADKLRSGVMGGNVTLQCYSGTEAVIVDPQVAGQANFQVGVAGTRNGNVELFGNSAAVGGKLVFYKGSTATGVSAYSVQTSALGVLQLSNGSENVLSLDGNNRRVGINVTAPSVALDVSGSGKFSGRLSTAASTSSGAGLNLPHGSAPETPVNGDVWTTSGGVYFHINGETVEAFGGATDWANPGIIGSSTPNEATFTNLIASNTMRAPQSTPGSTGFSIVPGVAPTSPANGDVWITSQGFYAHIGGITVGPMIDAARFAAPPGIGYETPNGGRFTSLESTGGFIAAAGTASTPSMKICSGVAPETPETGDIWADAEGFYFRISGKTLRLKEAWHAVGVSW